jgi:hypothetical protein
MLVKVNGRAAGDFRIRRVGGRRLNPASNDAAV